MKRTSIVLLMICATCVAVTVWAQRAKTKPALKPLNSPQYVERKDTLAIVKKPKVYYIPVYLGNSALQGGSISKYVFDSLLKQGLTARDTMGMVYKVDGFYFNYGERNLYEDSSGNMMWVTDYLSEYCPGNMLPAHISGSIYMRTKPGDTTYFDNIKLTRPSDNMPMLGKPMRFEIGR